MRRRILVLFVLSVLALVPMAARQAATKPAAQAAPAATPAPKPDAARLLGAELFRQAFGPPLASRPASDVFHNLVPDPDC